MAQRGYARECTIDQLQPNLHALVSRYISASDEILYCFENRWATSGSLLGGDGKNFGCYICTAHRFIQASITEDHHEFAETVEITDILSVQESHHDSLFLVSILLQGNKLMNIGFNNLEATSKFAAIVRDAVARAKASSPSAASSHSVEARIRALKQLRQDGLITEAQFQQKLQDIINQL